MRGIKISVLKTASCDIFVGNDSGDTVDKGSNFLLRCLTCSTKIVILGIVPNKEATRDFPACICLRRMERKRVMCCEFQGKRKKEKQILPKTKNSALQSRLRGMRRRDGAGTKKALSLAVESESL